MPAPTLDPNSWDQAILPFFCFNLLRIKGACHCTQLFFFLFFWSVLVLGIKSRALLSKHSTTELYPHAYFVFTFKVDNQKINPGK
jgi:hypothetical protein